MPCSCLYQALLQYLLHCNKSFHSSCFLLYILFVSAPQYLFLYIVFLYYCIFCFVSISFSLFFHFLWYAIFILFYLKHIAGGYYEGWRKYKKNQVGKKLNTKATRRIAGSKWGLYSCLRKRQTKSKAEIPWIIGKSFICQCRGT